jgi:hypothetical protein
MSKQKVPELIEFVHSNKELRADGSIKGVGPLIGCVIARRVRTRNIFNGQFQSEISIGWSQCAINMGDEFDKERAVKIARGRAIAGAAPQITRKIAPTFDRMVDRAARYFKQCNFA